MGFGLILALNILYNFVMVSMICGPGHPQDLQEGGGGLSLSGEETGGKFGRKVFFFFFFNYYYYSYVKYIFLQFL